MPIDFEDHIERRKFVDSLNEAINQFSIDSLTEGPRNHLGASLIGDECKARLWGIFRWLKHEKHNGRTLRLFDRGKREEAEFLTILRGVGFSISEFDDKGNQYRISGSKGHFGGSLDALSWRQDTLMLLNEFKTHNDKSFQKLKKEGVIRSKPQHYAQMCSYGKLTENKFGLYCAVNKNDDELYFEIVPLDWNKAEDLYRKADSIIFSQNQPAKISMTPTFFNCKYCHLQGICHFGEAPEKNCRSCRNARPVDDGKWQCDLFGIIPDDVIPFGCDSYARII